MAWGLSTIIPHTGYLRLLTVPMVALIWWKMFPPITVLVGGLGFACNLTAMAVNGWAMPVDPSIVHGVSDPLHVVMTAHSNLTFLVDRLWPGVGLSVGDVLITVGALGGIILRAVRTRHKGK